MKVVLGVSNRHCHITEEDYKILFRKTPFLKEKELRQQNDFASNQVVTLEAGDRTLENVRIVGPFRAYTQVELSKTDARFLKINPPIRESGNLEDAAIITLIGPYGKVTKPCAILATRHIHIDPATRKEMGLQDKEKVAVHFTGEKETTFYNVFFREQEDGVLELHLDTDDANGAQLKTGDLGKIEINSK